MIRNYSYNWIKEYVDAKLSADEFAKEFSLKSQTIDRVTDVKAAYSGVITAQIKKIEPHPNADKLRLVTVDTGGGEQTVVCGAPNIEEGQIVPLVREGGKVLAGKGNVGETMTVRKTEIRGVESHGMICSQFLDLL